MSISDTAVQGTPDTADEYDEMVSVLDEIIEHGIYKVTGKGRIGDEQKERARAEYMKRTEQAIRAKRKVIKDKRLQELGKTLEAIEESDEFNI